MKLYALCIVVTALFYLIECASASQKVHCYYTNWSQYRPDPMKFFPENIDVSLCDTVIYSFLEIQNHAIAYREWNEQEMLNRVVALKQQKPSLKVLVAVGGWLQASTAFSPMVTSASSRKIFVDSTVALLQKHGLDGLDIDWEYPGLRGGIPSDKPNLVLLCKELKEAFHQHGYMLTLAIGGGRHHVDAGYDLPNLAKYADHIGIMSYDFYVCPGASIMEHQAYYEPRPGMSNPEYSVTGSLNMMEEKGAPASKLVVGLPVYGRGYNLHSINPRFGDHVSGSCPAYAYSRENGIASYYEVCIALRQQGYRKKIDEVTGMPIAFSGQAAIGYDDEQSLTAKINFAKSRGYAGVMVWALDFDDFNGRWCGQGMYPLMRKIKEVVSGAVVPTPQPPVTPNPTTSSTNKPTVETTSGSGGSEDCKPGQIFYADKATGCVQFRRCDTGGLGGTCGGGLKFNNAAQVCDWAHNVVC